MKTLQFSIHIENNAQLHLSLPAEYANQDVELVVIIQPRQETTERQNWLAFIDQTYSSFPGSAWECNMNRSAVWDAGASPN